MNIHNINIENRLQQLCTENSEYAELWSTWNLNKQTLEPILNAIIKDYPHYSFHDISHSESILLNIERMLGNDNIEKLSPTDLWLILHVSYLHDFGMVILDTKIYDIWKSSNFQEFVKEQSKGIDEDLRKAAEIINNSDRFALEYNVTWPLNVKKATTILLSSYCRSRHAEFSREYILDINNVWGIDLGHNGLIKNRLISLIGNISNIHTKPFSKILSLHKESNGFKNDYMHPRLVACLLRMGDVLDLDNGRFNPYCVEIFGEMPKDSKNHFDKHEATRHVLVTNEIIEVEADCKSDEVYRETRRWFDSLKSEIDNLRLSWNDIAPSEFGRPPKLAMCKITRDGTDDLNDISNLKFNISQSKAFEIIEGSSIYKDRFSCLREIIQNAEDSSKIQLWRDIKDGMFYCKNGIKRAKVESGALLPNDIPAWIYEIYSIEINIHRNEKNNAVVSIQDHGTGISVLSLKDICNVGQSYRARSETKNEIDEMPEWLKPTANFGIGLQSCFMATDKFNIITKSTEGDSLKIIFESGKDSGYVNVKKVTEHILRGSEVQIEFKNDERFSYDMFGFTAQNLMNIEPFEKNCIVIYKIVESIFQECDSSFFDINVCSEEIGFQQTIPSYFAKNNTGDVPFIEQGKFRYKFSDENKFCSIWYNNSLYKINCIKFGGVRILFKGKNVTKHKYIHDRKYLGLNITIDIYGIPTKDALSLNREELTDYASQEIDKDLHEVIGLYMDLLAEKKSEIIDDTELIDSYFLCSWLYDKQFPSDLCENISKEPSIDTITYNKDSGEYEDKFISLADIYKSYPELSYSDYEFSRTLNNSQRRMALSELLRALNNSDINREKYNCIVIDNALKDYLKWGFCDYTYIPAEKAICIKTVNIGYDLYSPDEYTKKELIKSLVYIPIKGVQTNNMYIMRQAIHAFAEYENLAVKLEKVFFQGGDGSARWYIISPISLKDAAKVNELSKDAFVEYIVNNQLFDNIVAYVLKNAKLKDTTKETIIKDYKRLICEYYDITTAEASTQIND